MNSPSSPTAGSDARLRLLIPLDPVGSWEFVEAPQKQSSWGAVGDKDLWHLLGIVSPEMLPFAQHNRLSMSFSKLLDIQRKGQLTSPLPIM
jgi:hypothetical protein